jgi:tetratricopeptide (TPR) repeat protein
MLLSCSASKVTQSPPVQPVSFTEQQQLDYEHDFIEGTRLKLMGDLAGAANLLTGCTEANPNDAAAYFELSEIYTLVNDAKPALINAQLAVEKDTKNVWYKLHLAGLYANNKLTDSAIMVYQDIIALQPDDINLRFDLASLYLEADQYRQAMKEVKMIERIYGYTEEVAIAKYRIYSKKNDTKATEKLLLQRIEKYPTELRFYGLLAELYSSLGKKQEAQDNYQKLLDVDPENALGYVSMIEFYKDYGNDEQVLTEMRRMFALKAIDPDLKVELYLSITADTVFAKKYYRELDQMIEQLSEKNSTNFRVRMMNADRNLRRKNFEAARDDMLFLTDRVSTNVFLWEQLFYLLNLLQDNEILYESSAKALKYFEDNYLFNFFHGLSAFALKKTDVVIEFFDKTLKYVNKEKDPDKSIILQTYIFLGETYNEQKEYKKSDEVFEKALLMAPNNALILNNYSYYLSLREEKLDLAEYHIRKCITLEPNNSTYLDTYGWVLYKLGRVDEAINMIEKAMKTGGNDNYEIVNHMCELLVVAGRLDEAYHICKYALELNNDKETTVSQKIDALKKRQK